MKKSNSFLIISVLVTILFAIISLFLVLAVATDAASTLSSLTTMAKDGTGAMPSINKGLQDAAAAFLGLTLILIGADIVIFLSSKEKKEVIDLSQYEKASK